MSNAALHRVWKFSQARGAARCLMLALADVADERGIAYPGIDYLAEMVNEKAEYVDTLIKGRIEAGELYKIAGRGRGHKTRFAVLCGLPPDKQEELKGVLENPFSSPKKGQPRTPFSQEKGDSNRPIAKGLLQTPKRVTLSDSNDRPNIQAQSEQTPIAPNPDPMIPGGGGGGAPPLRDDPAPRPGTAAAPLDAPTETELLLLRFQPEPFSTAAAREFRDLPPDVVRSELAAAQQRKVGPGALVKRWRRVRPTVQTGESYEPRFTTADRPGRPAGRAPLDPDAVRAGVRVAKRDW